MLIGRLVRTIAVCRTATGRGLRILTDFFKASVIRPIRMSQRQQNVGYSPPRSRLALAAHARPDAPTGPDAFGCSSSAAAALTTDYTEATDRAAAVAAAALTTDYTEATDKAAAVARARSAARRRLAQAIGPVGGTTWGEAAIVRQEPRHRLNIWGGIIPSLPWLENGGGAESLALLARWGLVLSNGQVVCVIVFWLMVGLLAYTYVGFPLWVGLRGLCFPRPVRGADWTPTISLLIACHNEAGQIREKLENCLALDYPADKLQVIIASDGSTDATETLVESFLAGGFAPSWQLLRLPRGGKSRALNAAAELATGEIWVFTDANSQLPPGALRALVRPLADSEVGGVAGDQRYLRDTQWGGLQTGEYDYWSFDRWLKAYQSRAGSVTSATGALYAIRREYFQPLYDGMTDDFLASTRVIAAGKRLVFAADAVAYEAVAKTGQDEFQRKVRLMSRGLRGVVAMRSLLNPFRFGCYAFQLFSHKVLRRLAALPWLFLLLSSACLWNAGWVYRAALLLWLLALSWALLGWFATSRGWAAQGKIARRLLVWPAFFLMANGAALLAAWNLIRGTRYDRWETGRSRVEG